MKSLKSSGRALFFPPGTTPLKWKVHFIFFLCMFCSAISIAISFPFLPAMVKSFGVSDEETGYDAGLIASAVFIGRAAGSYLWGWLADRFGRRPVVIINLAWLAASMTAFGMSVSINMAIVTRLFAGLGNGLVVTTKAMTSEVCDDSNQALGISVIMASWNFGLIIGPALGGFMVEPSQKYPKVFPKGSVFDRFAFLLPCLLNSVVALISLVLAYFYLPETLVKRKENSTYESSELAHYDEKISSETNIESNKHILFPESGRISSASPESSEVKHEMRLLVCEGDVKEDGMQQNSPRGSNSCCLTCKNSNIVTLFRNRVAMLAIGVYCTFSFVVIGFEELFTLWAATQTHNGGLGFSTDKIGTALLSVVVPLLVLQVFVFAKMERRFGISRVFRLACAVAGIGICVLPSINNFYNRSSILWPLLIGILLPLRLSFGCGFSSIALFINNSVSSDLLGSVNGLAVALSSLSRGLGPLVGGSVFAWSITKGVQFGFPLDEHFTFILFTFGSILSLLLSCTLPKYTNQRNQNRETRV